MEWMAVVRDRTGIRLIALRRPSYHLTACEPAGPCPAASGALCDCLEKGLASRTGRQHRRTHEMSVLTLRRPSPLPGLEGRVRQAAEASLAHVDALLRAGRQFVWVDERGAPVSMAAFGRDLPHGMAVAAVYTPPEERSRCYATALVAALCRRILDGEKRMSVCLRTTAIRYPATYMRKSASAGPVRKRNGA